jgi:hypothetical protein
VTKNEQRRDGGKMPATCLSSFIMVACGRTAGSDLKSRPFGRRGRPSTFFSFRQQEQKKHVDARPAVA